MKKGASFGTTVQEAPFAIIDDERRYVRLKRIALVAANPSGGRFCERSSGDVNDEILGWVLRSRFWERNRYCKTVKENMDFPDGCSESGEG